MSPLFSVFCASTHCCTLPKSMPTKKQVRAPAHMISFSRSVVAHVSSHTTAVEDNRSLAKQNIGTVDLDSFHDTSSVALTRPFHRTFLPRLLSHVTFLLAPPFLHFICVVTCKRLENQWRSSHHHLMCMVPSQDMDHQTGSKLPRRMHPGNQTCCAFC
jgi:hypothetical protein